MPYDLYKTLTVGHERAATDPEKYVRESFTWRRMTKGQVWTLTVVSAALLAAVIISEMI